MHCVHPKFIQIRDQFDELVHNRACRCLHSITLASLTLLRTPASTNWSGKERRSKETGAAARTSPWSALWQWRGNAEAALHRAPPSLPRHALASQHHTAPPGRGNWSPPTPTPMPAHAQRRPSSHRACQSVPPPAAELTPRHPTPSFLLPGHPAP